MRFDIEKEYTVGELYGPAMKIEDEAGAATYLDDLVAYVVYHRYNEGDPISRDEAETLVRGNLGYFAGYYDMETNVRVQRLFGCKHPIFGSAEDMAKITAEEAFEEGRARGEALRRGLTGAE